MKIFNFEKKVPKYEVNYGAYKVRPKKNKWVDIRRWSNVFLFLAIGGLTHGANYLINIKSYVACTDSTTSSSLVVSDNSSNPSDSGEEGEINILSLELEQIEALANTIAGRNAVWPGYKGDPDDHKAVQAHFSQSFAKWINSGLIQVKERWKGKSVAFAYAVGNNGVINFIGKIPGGNLNDDYAYVEIQNGISGKMLVTPAQDEAGEDIIMIYYIKVKFAIQ